MSSDDFMSKVREYRCLYDKATKDFKDVRKKENAWREVSECFSMTPSEAEKKYKNIRTVFGRYLTKLKPPSGSGRDAIQLSPEYEHLRWLITYISRRATTSNINKQKPSDNTDIINDQQAEDELYLEVVEDSNFDQGMLSKILYEFVS